MGILAWMLGVDRRECENNDSSSTSALDSSYYSSLSNNGDDDYDDYLVSVPPSLIGHGVSGEAEGDGDDVFQRTNSYRVSTASSKRELDFELADSNWMIVFSVRFSSMFLFLTSLVLLCYGVKAGVTETRGQIFLGCSVGLALICCTVIHCADEMGVGCFSTMDAKLESLNPTGDHIFPIIDNYYTK
jgi:hypothetical protein